MTTPPHGNAVPKEGTIALMPDQPHAIYLKSNPGPLHGRGLFTDVEVEVEVEVEARDPRLRHKRHMSQQFLPIDDPGHTHRFKKRRELPESVLKVYGELKAILRQEEEDIRRGVRQDPVDRFGRLEYPTILPPPSLPPPPPPPPPVETASAPEKGKGNGEKTGDFEEEIVENNVAESTVGVEKAAGQKHGRELGKKDAVNPREEVQPNIASQAISPSESVDEREEIAKSSDQTPSTTSPTSPKINTKWEDDSDVEFIECRTLLKKPAVKEPQARKQEKGKSVSNKDTSAHKNTSTQGKDASAQGKDASALKKRILELEEEIAASKKIVFPPTGPKKAWVASKSRNAFFTMRF